MIDFSCDLLSLYPAVHFLTLWLSCIIAIMNTNGECASPWNIPLWIFVSAKLLPPAVYSTLKVFMVSSIKFMNSCDILYIFRQFIIQLCGTISYAFLLSIQAHSYVFFCLVLLSFRIRWSNYSNSAVPLDHFAVSSLPLIEQPATC